MPRVTKYEAPASYEELFEMYFGYIEAMLVKAGIHPQRVPDEAMTIIANLIKTNFLASYDGDRLWRIGTVDGKKVTLKQDEEAPEGFIQTGERTAPFMSPFRTYVSLSARAALDRQIRDTQRGVQLPEDDSWIRPTHFGGFSMFTGAEPPAFQVERAESLRVVREELAEISERQNDEVNLAVLMDSIHELMEFNNGELPKSYMKILAEKLAVTEYKIKAALKDLRTILTDAGLQPSVRSAA